MKRAMAVWLSVLALFAAARADAAGTLTPLGSPHAPIQIRDHDVQVSINNGFAMTEVHQVFYNPNDVDLEAIYAFPLPKSASLSEFTIFAGEKRIDGEVVPRAQAEQTYAEERDRGNDAGLASKNDIQTFEFAVSPVRAKGETGIRFVYYQPLEIDTGIGRYVYPLEEGGTDDVGASFWLRNAQVEGTFSATFELKSAWPVQEVRVPGFETEAAVQKLDEGHYRVDLTRTGAKLDRDLVLYYRLQDGLPGRVEVIPYRANEKGPGTFMMVVTPGLDLQPLTRGADYAFVLDVSGSMGGKIHSLARGVERALGELRPDDRFRVVTFNDTARELTSGWVNATPDAVKEAIRTVQGLQASGSTNLYDGISLGFQRLDDDRATSVVLVTDAVTNTGVVDPKAFHRLLEQYDVRVFGFLLGNSANWPLMRTIAEASGGFSAGVSNADDLLGQLLLAKSKITYESLHDAELEVKGVNVYDVTGKAAGKIYRGEQLVLFGHYDKGGEATVELRARLTGADKTYSTTFTFPDVDTDNPEIERLWALSQIEQVEDMANASLMESSEVEPVVRDLGVAYQLVTDYTSMLVLDDEAFERHGIERRNRARVAVEHQAQALRASQPVRNYRVDQAQPMFQHAAPAIGGGGSGALDPFSAAVAVALGGLALGARRRARRM